MSTISNISIDQGAHFGTLVSLKDTEGFSFDLSGYTASAEIRKSYQSSTSSIMDASISQDEKLGTIFLSMNDTQTSQLEFGRYVWDLLLTNPSGIKTRAVEGIATVNPSVTRTEPVTTPLGAS